MKIYFAGAVRGGSIGDVPMDLATRIDALSLYGDVLTDHMAMASMDAGRDDAAIHAHDQTLLAEADVLVADTTVPSTGTGYMIARACARGIPVLALHAAGARPSAMIAGSPDITFERYAHAADFIRKAHDFFVARGLPTRAPNIFLAGKPGCGKGTLGKRLAELAGLPHVSTGDIIRGMVPTTPELAAYVNAGRLVPAELMRKIVGLALAGYTAANKRGMILDGYPPSRDDLANLAAIGLHPDVVIYLDVTDATSIARQVKRAARPTDNEDRARRRVDEFHAQSHDVTTWYPGRLVVRIDGEQDANIVEATAVALLRDTFGGTHHERSYYAIPPANAHDPRSTRLHFHVDGPDVDYIRSIARELHVRTPAAQGQVKIYPIRGLALGPQQPRLAIYPQLPNFHAIAYPSRTEAFITGRLGDGDRPLMEVVLATTRDRGGMAELEEYVGEWTLLDDGTIREDAIYDPLPDDHAYPAYDHARCAQIPRWELHHGFDLPKTEPEPPIPLADLVQRCAAAGLDNGGWFLFANDRHWAYRSNEFSDDTHDAVMARLVAQAQILQTIARVPIGFSLEIVHGIWTFG